VSGTGERDNELSHPIKGQEFPDLLNDYELLYSTEFWTAFMLLRAETSERFL
jgi:hypothetical protein